MHLKCVVYKSPFLVGRINYINEDFMDKVEISFIKGHSIKTFYLAPPVSPLPHLGGTRATRC